MENNDRKVQLPIDKSLTRDGNSMKKRKTIISGGELRIVQLLMFFNLFWIALLKYRMPGLAFKLAWKVYNRRLEYKTNQPKIAKLGKRYFMNLNTPGWPSKAFDRYIHHLLNIYAPLPETRLFTLVFAITNKCGFQCEHCVEWEQLNHKDHLSKEDVVAIIQKFHRIGISQVQLSGGEPTNRLDDILYIMENAPKGIDFWIYTNGYQLSAAKAARLKNHGLTGVIISLDHHDPGKHDQFRGIRGSYKKALESAQHAIDRGLSLAFSCCATNEFISRDNLLRYAKICRDAGASFIQVLEPEAIGHYWQKNVTLKKENKQVLEDFFQLLNFDKAYATYPIVSYPAMIKRYNGCPGAAAHFLYVDADGDVHSCPFCKKKLFAATDPDLENKVRLMKENGCSLPVFDLPFQNIGQSELQEHVL